MNPRTHNMLMAARALLDNSGPDLTTASDSLTVARKLLVTQDVIELVLAALLIEADAKTDNNDRTVFEALVGKVVGLYRADDSDEVRESRRATFKAVNHRRVRFKHFGDLPEVWSTVREIGAATHEIEVLCERAIGIRLHQVDAVATLYNPDIASYLRDAEQARKEGCYQTSLERIARALSIAFWEYEALSAVAGVPDSEVALLLSGRGIDPASFISMQRFLPKIWSPFSEDVEFETRVFGHEANWSERNARFCWETALTVISRLQHASPIPQATDFYDEFVDVLTIVANPCIVTRIKGFGNGEEKMPRILMDAAPGETFVGRVKGFYGIRETRNDELNFEMNLLTASWIQLTRHSLQDGGYSPLFGVDELWFRASDVQISYQESAIAAGRRKFLEEQRRVEQVSDDERLT